MRLWPDARKREENRQKYLPFVGFLTKVYIAMAVCLFVAVLAWSYVTVTSP